MLSVRTNLQALRIGSALQNNLRLEAVSQERLASGKRINRAADDAAGLQISTRLTQSVIADSQILRNLADGISYAQIAEGALSQVTTNLQRMRQLSVQAQNGVNNQADRLALDAEFQQLSAEIQRIAKSTEAFGKQPLLGEPPEQRTVPAIDELFTNGQSGNFSSGLVPIAYIPAGSTDVRLDIDSFGQDDDIQLFASDGTHLAGTPLSDRVWLSQGVTAPSDFDGAIYNPANGFDDDAAYDATNLNSGGTQNFGGMNITYSGDGDLNNNGNVSGSESPLESIIVDYATSDLSLFVVGTGSFNYTVSWSGIGDPLENFANDGDIRITAADKTDSSIDFIDLDKTPSTLTDLGLLGLSLDPVESAESALSALDEALADVANSRGFYGAKLNQMSSAIRSNLQQKENTSAARMRITDTDFAAETGQLTTSQIVKNASISLLTQANASPQQALVLLNQGAR